LAHRPATNRDLTDEEAAYSRRLYDAVLATVIGLDGDDTGQAGIVRPHIVRMTMADIAATVDGNCALVESPRDCRQFGEDLAERYKVMAGSLEEADTGAWPKATKIEPGTFN